MSNSVSGAVVGAESATESETREEPVHVNTCAIETAISQDRASVTKLAQDVTSDAAATADAPVHLVRCGSPSDAQAESQPSCDGPLTPEEHVSQL